MEKIKIYLCNPPFKSDFSRCVRGVGESTRGGTLYYPIWLSYAAGLLEADGHEVRLVDAIAWKWDMDQVIKDAVAFNPGLVVVETNFASLKNDIAVAGKLKYLTGAVTVIVGPPSSQFPEIIVNSGIDAVARFEYDLTLEDLAHRLDIGSDWKSMPGITCCNNGEIIHNPNREYAQTADLDRIPFISKVYRRHLNIRDYFLSSSLYPQVQIFSGRGCPNHCTFCSWPVTLSGRRYRYRSVNNLLDEFQYIVTNLPEVKEIFIEDDTFTIDKKRILEFCQDYTARGLSISWSCNARVSLNYETMLAMKKANCRLLVAGFESGSKEVLKNIKKGVTVEQIREFSANARKAGLLVHGDFIIGLPGETRETISETRQLLNEVRPEILQVLLPQPIPGTELYEWCRGNGYLLENDPDDYLVNGYIKPVVDYPNLASGEMLSEVNKILKEYYLSPRYIPLALRQVLRKNGLIELKRLYYSARMFLRFVNR